MSRKMDKYGGAKKTQKEEGRRKEEEPNFSAIADSLANIFGQLIERDALLAVVESCGGDESRAVEALLDIVGQTQPGVSGHQEPPCSTSQATTSNYQQPQVLNPPNQQPSSSYCNVAKAPGTTFNQNTAMTQQKYKLEPVWPEDIRRIFYYHNKGYQTLIMLRGLPGSGKSYLARRIVEMTVGSGPAIYNDHVFSSDDFFYVNGKYIHRKDRLGDAHDWNKRRVFANLSCGRSPVIVDNTNMKYWEMEPYVKVAVQKGYYIEILEPTTPWAWNISQLFKKNKHNVPYETIKRMKDKFDPSISGQEYIRLMNLHYFSNKQPPQLRLIPVIEKNPLPSQIQVVSDEGKAVSDECKAASDEGKAVSDEDKPVSDENMPVSDDDKTKSDEDNAASDPEKAVSDKNEALSDHSKVVSDQDNDVSDQDNAVANYNKTLVEQHHQIENNSSSQSGVVMAGGIFENDGSSRDNSEGIRDNSDNSEGINLEKYAVVAKKLEEFETIDNEWEKGEHWEDQNFEQFQTTNTKSPQRNPKPQRNRDREQLLPNVNYSINWPDLFPPWQQDIPAATETEITPVETRSSSTCIELGDCDDFNSKYKVVIGSKRDINDKYKPSINKSPKKCLMFDKSTVISDDLLGFVEGKGDKNLFEQFRKMFQSVPRNDLRDIFDKCGGDVSWAVEMVIGGVPISENDQNYNTSESEEEDNDDCMAPESLIAIKDEEKAIRTTVSPSLKKNKKLKLVSESSLKLKRQLEKNIVMPDKFYAEHTLKLRKSVNPVRPANPEGEGTSQDRAQSSSSSEKENSDTEVSSIDADENITFNLGREFVQNLDRLFGRGEDSNWNEHIMPVINVPMSIVNQINALWMESLAYQVESQAAYSKLMLEQDKEFARQLAAKEEELSRSGQAPPVPDLKEIMDMDLALTLYRKDVEQWRNKIPNDLAAKLTIKKLANLFDNISEEILSEMLMAHDNCYLATIETLLMSTGQGHVLEQENGVNKLVMEKEMQRQAKVIEEEKRKQLESAEWPVLTQLDVMDMETVQSYRNTATVHLQQRNANYNKAQSYFSRGMTTVAGIYSDVASFHKKMFDQANTMAATALVHVNMSQQSPEHKTLDLHYLFVAEALQTLDLFIDYHIQLLKEQFDWTMLKTSDLFIITGRGLHSNGGPRIKPAVRKRLKQRGLRIYELNPGLVSIKLTKDCALTHELPNNV